MGDIANVESFEIDGTPAALVSPTDISADGVATGHPRGRRTDAKARRGKLERDRRMKLVKMLRAILAGAMITVGVMHFTNEPFFTRSCRRCPRTSCSCGSAACASSRSA